MRPVRWHPPTKKLCNVADAPRSFENKTGSNGVSDADNSLPPSGQTLTQALNSLVRTLEALSVRYAIIGGIATIQHTRLRTTNDVDALLNPTQLATPGMLDALKANGFTVDLQRSIRELRVDGLTTIQFGQVLVDMMRPVLPVYSHVLDRAIRAEILGQSVRISSAEGLIVMKLIAFRPQDESDIRDLLAAYQGQLDLEYIRSEFATVAELDDPRWVKFESWRRELWV